MRVARGAKKLVAFSRRYGSVLRKPSLWPDSDPRWVSNVALRAAVGAPPKVSSIVDTLCGLVLLKALEHHVGIRAARDVDVDEALGFIQLAGAGVLRLNPQRNGRGFLCLGEVAGIAQEAPPSA